MSFMNRNLKSRLNEMKIESMKNQAFYDFVKLWIRQFRLEDSIINSRQYDSKNVSRLIRIFELENCLRFHSKHHVSIIVFKRSLNDALRIDKSFVETLRSIKKLNLLSLHEDVSYLHEAYRLKTNNSFLHSNDRWWIANLYLEKREKSSSLLCFSKCLIDFNSRLIY